MQTNTIQDAAAALPSLVDLMNFLTPNDQRFAGDLIRYHGRKGYVTPGQAPWVGKLIERAEARKAPVETEKAQPIGDCTALKALFDRAACHLKAPAVVINVADVGLVRVYVGRANSRHAGKTCVVDYGKTWPVGKFYGWIKEGQFEPKKYVPTPATLIDGLKAFALDPIGHAKAYGKLTGKCCFCTLPLEDERSTGQGYGPICAKHYGLPWGERPAKDTVFLASDVSAKDQGTMDLTGLETPDGTEAPFEVEIPE